MMFDVKNMLRDAATESVPATLACAKTRTEIRDQSDGAFEDDCAHTGMATDELIHSLDEASQHESLVGELRGFQLAPLTQIVNYLVDKHHAFARQELICLDVLLDKVCSVHGTNHPEVLRIRSLFKSLYAELTMHMRTEEEDLFPYIRQMEDALHHRQPLLLPVFGTISHPVRLMTLEHPRAIELLDEIRRVSLSYTVPPDGCLHYRMLYQALKDFEQDVKQHLYLEDKVLFPRAVKMESRAYLHA